ncbi:MAG: hypothetical protein KKD39_02090, partial [Candidatus Altiarchaeota archaeon]|nr:hypothetical protein [Candidatus Altiarchaeota archaeon]
RDASLSDLRLEWLGQMYQKYGSISRVMRDVGVKPGVPGESEPEFSLSPNLKREGIEAVMKLSAELSHTLAPPQRNQFIRSLVIDGYYCSQDGYSLVVNVPKWAYVGSDGFTKYSGGRTELVKTGLGDTAGSLGAIGCMMSETQERKDEVVRQHGWNIDDKPLFP